VIRPFGNVGITATQLNLRPGDIVEVLERYPVVRTKKFCIIPVFATSFTHTIRVTGVVATNPKRASLTLIAVCPVALMGSHLSRGSLSL
jgi:hypothetical protein